MFMCNRTHMGACQSSHLNNILCWVGGCGSEGLRGGGKLVQIINSAKHQVNKWPAECNKCQQPKQAVHEQMPARGRRWGTSHACIKTVLVEMGWEIDETAGLSG